MGHPAPVLEALRMSARTATSAPPFVPEGLWAVDSGASSARFSVKHLLVATVRGRFGTVVGTISATGRTVQADGSVQVATIDTGLPDRDARLRGEGFFDADSFPEISFRSTRAVPAGHGTWTITGDLTVMGRRAPLEFLAKVSRGARGPHVRAHATLSRSEHGLDWPGLLHSGRAVVGDRVEIELDLVLR